MDNFVTTQQKKNRIIAIKIKYIYIKKLYHNEKVYI